MREAAEDPKKIWKMAKWARGDTNQRSTPPQFPAIKDKEGTLQETLEGKAKALAQEFFPEPTPVDLSDIPNTVYPEEIPVDCEITPGEVQKIFSQLAAYKAPGPDQIPNLFLKQTKTELSELVAPFMQACIQKGYLPKPFKTSTTVVLRKPQKPDYSKAWAYRPIALLNTISKVLEALVAKRLSTEAEERNLFPQHQMGARPGRSTISALELITEQVQAIWGTHKGHVASMLCLDISGAFPSVSHPRLIHHLKACQIPSNLVQFVQSFLQDRTTCLRLGEYTDIPRPQPTGIPQGSTLSPILFLYFARTLLTTRD